MQKDKLGLVYKFLNLKTESQKGHEDIKISVGV
jgi:hypothetical protein